MGEEFLAELERAMDRIQQDPQRFTRTSGWSRKCNLFRFPFAIVYSLEGEVLFVKAVMHLARKPAYWMNRTKF